MYVKELSDNKVVKNCPAHVIYLFILVGHFFKKKTVHTLGSVPCVFSPLLDERLSDTVRAAAALLEAAPCAFQRISTQTQTHVLTKDSGENASKPYPPL